VKKVSPNIPNTLFLFVIGRSRGELGRAPWSDPAVDRELWAHSVRRN